MTLPQYQCTPPLNMMNNAMVVDIPYAEQLARNQVDFTGFSSGAQLELQNLYEALVMEPGIRTQSAILDSFYTASNTGIRQDIYHVKDLLNSWQQDSTAMVDSALFMSNLQSIRTANNNISTNVLGVQNEKDMTTLYLNILEKGLDSLTAAQKAGIETLAAECPYNSGRGVFTARALQAFYQPGITYNDKGICGMAYKNGGEEAEEEKDREEMEKLLHESLLTENNILMYPNPACDNITIKYRLTNNEQATVELIDMLGRIEQVIYLNTDAQAVTVKINNLPAGVYNYRYKVNGRQLQTGKLLIK